MNQKKIKFFLGLLAIIAVFVFLNFGYLWKNAKVWLSSPAKTSNIENFARNLEPNTLFIESLQIKAPVVYPIEQNEKSFQEALLFGVAHYPGTANPGEVGNVYIFGHSSDYFWSKGKYKSVFAALPGIEIGSSIILSNSQGVSFTYKAVKSFSASAKDTYLLSQDTQGKKILTLQTSWPVGTALKRWIVVAELAADSD